MAMEPNSRKESARNELPVRQSSGSKSQDFGRINYGDQGDSDRLSMRSHRDH